VIGPDGVAQFDELRRRNGAKRAMLYGFDLIELNGRGVATASDRLRRLKR
jgi:ATP-dependent DNA ligase